ncbi:MAG: STAS/SEC14 domain-containing protein [Candidatus Thiothrix singaporensis]|uniref:STAS/SEC14 domain-containing protein n=1 Tax=Candidatus Thiothrix singaporensis TaxID=2799669 RepID=A0A7L6AQS4_9GAMM|nr:MAG: STAS/SEC14 domain-containing protein [Candidatus Thiothrix singaporensis]
MIKELPESEGSVLGFEISGKVTLDEEKAWIARLDKVLEEHGKVSVLAVLDEGAGWGVKAGIEDLQWIMKNMKKLDRIAIVSDSSVWKWLIAVDSQFAKMIGIGEKYFETSQIADAWKWIKA